MANIVKLHTPKILSIILFTTFFYSGCSLYDPTADFVKQRYTNTIAYFNTFYNAQRSFNEAESEVHAQLKTNRAKSITVQSNFQISSSARAKFTVSIEKNSKLLSYYPTSKWVDDALLMIGKAYYYLEEDVKAERKFLEMFAKYSNSALISEAQLWLGKTQLRQKKYAEGILQEENLYSSSVQQGNTLLAGSAAFVLAQYYFSINEFDKAVKYYSESIQHTNDDEVNAQSQFQIGLCYDKMNDAEHAEQAFAKVKDFSPDYGALFQSTLQRIRMISKQKKYDVAIDELHRLLTDSKNTEYFASIHYEIGNNLLLQGNDEDAVIKYHFVDSTFAKTDESAKSYFAVAQLYETKLMNYDSARKFYDMARIEFSASEITIAATKKSELFSKYFLLTKEILRFDSLLFEAKYPKIVKDTLVSTIQDSTSKKNSADSSAKKPVKFNPSLVDKKKIGALNDTTKVTEAARPAPIAIKVPTQQERIDSLQRLIAKTKFELAGLFYLEMNQLDSAISRFMSIATTTVDSELVPRSLFTVADIYRTARHPKKEIDSLHLSIIEHYPRTTYAQESRRYLGLPLAVDESNAALEKYMKAETFIFSNKTDSAITMLRGLISTNSQLSSQALYTLGWLYENTLQQNDSAIAVYRRIVTQFPSSKFASVVQPKLAEVDREKQEAEQKVKTEKERIEKEKAANDAALKKESEQKKVEEKLPTEIKTQNTVTDSTNIKK